MRMKYGPRTVPDCMEFNLTRVRVTKLFEALGNIRSSSIGKDGLLGVALHAGPDSFATEAPADGGDQGIRDPCFGRRREIAGRGASKSEQLRDRLTEASFPDEVNGIDSIG